MKLLSLIHTLTDRLSRARWGQRAARGPVVGGEVQGMRVLVDHYRPDDAPRPDPVSVVRSLDGGL